MKTSTILIVLLFAFTTKTYFSALASTAVLDSNGDAIQPGVEYYVVSWLNGLGGGGLLHTFDHQKLCPEIVIQSPFDNYQGLSVIFSPVDSTNEHILENANITVTFVPQTTFRCPTSTVWQVVYDEASGRNMVTLGGVEGETATYFTLKKNGAFWYKFSHLGNDITRISERSTGLIRLGESEFPWSWSLVKAESLKGHGKIKQVVKV